MRKSKAKDVWNTTWALEKSRSMCIKETHKHMGTGVGTNRKYWAFKSTFLFELIKYWVLNSTLPLQIQCKAVV